MFKQHKHKRRFTNNQGLDGGCRYHPSQLIIDWSWLIPSCSLTKSDSYVHMLQLGQSQLDPGCWWQWRYGTLLTGRFVVGTFGRCRCQQSCRLSAGHSEFLGVCILVHGGCVAVLDELGELVVDIRQRVPPVSKRAVVAGAWQTACMRTVVTAALLARRKDVINHVAEVRIPVYTQHVLINLNMPGNLTAFKEVKISRWIEEVSPEKILSGKTF